MCGDGFLLNIIGDQPEHWQCALALGLALWHDSKSYTIYHMITLGYTVTVTVNLPSLRIVYVLACALYNVYIYIYTYIIM